MEKIKMEDLRKKADLAYQCADTHPDRIALRYAALAAVIPLAVAAVCYYLAEMTANATGLSGMGMRSLLETAQTVIRLAAQVFLPFWGMGMLFVGIRLVQDRNAVAGDLWEGFRRFFPLLRLFLLTGVIYLAIFLISANAAAILFTLSPLSASMMKILEPVLESTADAQTALEALDETAREALLRSMQPAFYMTAGIFALISVPLSFRLRMAPFFILSERRVGAFAAVSMSLRQMKRRCLQLFRVDLHLWWYYALILLLAAVSSGDVILRELNVTVPFSETAAYFGCAVLYAGGLFLVEWLSAAWVNTQYAAFYDAAASQAAPVQPRAFPDSGEN